MSEEVVQTEQQKPEKNKKTLVAILIILLVIAIAVVAILLLTKKRYIVLDLDGGTVAAENIPSKWWEPITEKDGTITGYRLKADRGAKIHIAEIIGQWKNPETIFTKDGFSCGGFGEYPEWTDEKNDAVIKLIWNEL